MHQSSIDAAVVRLVAALEVLSKASPEALAQHADALNGALWTIDRLVISRLWRATAASAKASGAINPL
jgi:hypothetical protein